jgi:hypothetical protein
MFESDKSRKTGFNWNTHVPNSSLPPEYEFGLNFQHFGIKNAYSPRYNLQCKAAGLILHDLTGRFKRARLETDHLQQLLLKPGTFCLIILRKRTILISLKVF